MFTFNYQIECLYYNFKIMSFPNFKSLSAEWAAKDFFWIHFFVLSLY